MKSNRSFQLRLLLGSILLTAGLLALAHMIFLTFFIRRHFAFKSADATIVVLALLFVCSGLLVIRSGLIPFRRLRERLLDVRDSRQQTVTGDYPSEVQPLVDDLNSLLEQRDHAVREAQAKAGDLAHGLKTPLAILTQEAERVRRKGDAELAAAIEVQIQRMRRHIEYQLAQARAAATGNTLGVRSSVKESAEALSRTLQRLYADRVLAIRILASDEHFVRMLREDLDEVLGNLLDNACKWAKTYVQLSSHVVNHELFITIEDDGPGIAASLRESVLQRGVRADETAPGSGLGLAIVSRLLELYRGTISLDESPMGGLRAKVCLPVAG